MRTIAASLFTRSEGGARNLVFSLPGQGMEQRRQTARVATFQEAQIVLATGEHLACTIENVSTAGVLLLTAHVARIPSVFDLAFSADGELVRCHIAWIGVSRVGAAFESPLDFSQAA